MKTHYQLFSVFSILLVMLLASCGPAPNPKLVAKADEPKAVEQPPARPVVEEPRPEVVVKPKRETPVRAVAAKPAPAPSRQPVSTRPAPAARPTEDTAANQPGTITLPAPFTRPELSEPTPPTDEVRPERPERVDPPSPRQVRVPSGTLVSIRMIDPVDSETATVGDTFKASLDAPIIVDGETIFADGSDVYVKLAKSQSAGRVRGRSELQLQLDRIVRNGKSYLLDSSTHVTTGASQSGRTARTAGIGAAIGAAIGAISGGGKGAAVGAATGAGAGVGVEAIRKGEQVRLDSETQLDFRLEESIEVTLQPASSTSQRNNPSGPVRFGTRP